MTYKINKTDGTLITEVIDSAIDTTATDLTLIGKNVTGYGEYLNENFIKLLENFASTSEPNNPITGQLWFDTSENRLKVYDGGGFRVGGGPIVSSSQPQVPNQGDLWINSNEKTLQFFDGINWYAASKIWKQSQGKSGFEIKSVFDTDGNLKTLTFLYSAGTLLGIYSSHVEFMPSTDEGNSSIIGYPSNTTIKPGFNVANVSDFIVNANAATANALIDDLGNLKPASSFVITDGNSFINGKLVIADSEPLTLGEGQDTKFNVETGLFKISNNYTVDFKITQNANTGSPVDALTIKSLSNRVGIYNNNPQAALDVDGDVIISGGLTVNGDITYINSSAISVDDINIELGATSNPSDTTADGGGIILKGTTDHSILWMNSDDSWNSSENFNIAFGKSYRINNVDVLSETTLSSSVVNSSLTSVGVLTNLQVGNLTVIGNTISSTAGNIVLNPSGFGVVDVQNSKITNLVTPTVGDPGHVAATKEYVDSSLSAPWQEVSSTTVSLAGDRFLVDTGSGSVSIVLPSVPVAGDTIRFIDAYDSFDTDNLKILRYRNVDLATLAGTSASLSAGTYNSVPTTSVGGGGSGLILDVVVGQSGATYTSLNTAITVVSHGVGYVDGETVKVLGTDLGGASPANDLIVDLKLLNIVGNDADLTVSTQGAAFGLIYVNASQGWKYAEKSV